MEEHTKRLAEKYDYLNEIEVEALTQLIENKTLVNALKKVLLEQVYVNGELEAGKEDTFGRNLILAEMSQPIWENSPISEYGTHVKTLVNATKLVLTGINKLNDFKVVKPEKVETKNRGK